MSSLFVPKKKPRRPPPTNNAPSPAGSTPSSTGGSKVTPNPLAGPSSSAGRSNGVNVPSDPSKIVKFKLVSSGADSERRYNLMKLNSARDVDPRQISQPLLMNRKQPQPKGPPIWARDDTGKIIGKFVYDAQGKPVMDSNGEQVIEKKTQIDMSLVGGAPGEGAPRRRIKKGVKEVFHQDIEVIRLRREENTPWILEAKGYEGPTQEKGVIPKHWVGRMTEASSMPTVLLVNDGTMGMGFKVVPLGRSYRFEPDRPFVPLDADEANKVFEYNSKHRIYDRWAHREGGPSSSAAGPSTYNTAYQDERVRLFEEKVKIENGDVKPSIKREAFDDDYKREGRRLERGMEGGVDEELDYDFNEEFQDDEENNTFYRNQEEEEDAKLQEEQLKKEFRLANANVGDRPHVEDDSDEEEDLFGDKLNDEGRKLRKMMRKRGINEDDFGTSGSDTDSDDDTVESDNKDKDKASEKSKSREGSAAPSDSGRPSSRPSSRNSGLALPSPSGKRPNMPNSKKANTAPPGSGSALLAQRAASRGASPRRSRQGSPSGRAASPDGLPQHSMRANSPVLPGGASREVSPTPSASGQNRPAPGSRPGSTGGPQPGQGQRKAGVHSLSPGPSGVGMSPGSKRKMSPTPTGAPGGAHSGGGGDTGSRKKKKSTSLTPTRTPTPGPPDIAPFPGMITRDDVVAWFRAKGKKVVPMGEAISAFKDQIRNAGDRQADNQKVFLGIIQTLTSSEPNKMLRVREGIL